MWQQRRVRALGVGVADEGGSEAGVEGRPPLLAQDVQERVDRSSVVGSHLHTTRQAIHLLFIVYIHYY